LKFYPNIVDFWCYFWRLKSIEYILSVITCNLHVKILTCKTSCKIKMVHHLGNVINFLKKFLHKNFVNSIRLFSRLLKIFVFLQNIIHLILFRIFIHKILKILLKNFLSNLIQWLAPKRYEFWQSFENCQATFS